MDELAGKPKQDALTNLVTSAHSEAEISNIFQQLGGGGATVSTDKRKPEGT